MTDKPIKIHITFHKWNYLFLPFFGSYKDDLHEKLLTKANLMFDSEGAETTGSFYIDKRLTLY